MKTPFGDALFVAFGGGVCLVVGQHMWNYTYNTASSSDLSFGMFWGFVVGALLMWKATYD